MKKLINLLASVALSVTTLSPAIAGNPDSTLLVSNNENGNELIENTQGPIVVTPDDYIDRLGEKENNFMNPTTMKVYPNPSSKLDLKMELPVAPTQLMHVFLYDLEGKMIFAQRGHYEDFERIVIEGAKPGNYILRAFTPDQAYQTRITIAP
ncbi:MAG: T9SS type A sorting domain-containing protein [Bacteroidota bacterium]|nr:T9SS type A sorting domain-containing protein [Bacteroidota bacterium]MDX5428114.1 T9SS type A sorting domain-containing protein [Bacteroidota bacterium]MDX5447330.1 T9SS type A sorting domain-containing protein [Bacteroidota bacterium]MDX5505928.1 T9SS type A sorting domain-containing protein [Bacteroidota bacterium]